MKLTLILGANQVLSHGFGVFLFAALFPLMRDDLGLTYWHLTAVGIATQAAYLGGAISIGWLGRFLAAEKMILIAGACSVSLLFTLSLLEQPFLLITVLALLAFSAAVCWGSIVGIITEHIPADQAASSLSAAGSGTAWGYGVNGLLLLFLVPLFGWELTWVVTAVVGLSVFLLTWRILGALPKADSPESVDVLAGSGPVALSMRQLFRAVFTEQRAGLSCAIYFFIGFVCITFSSWLNSYLDELQASELAGMTWTILGLSGMLAGAGMGRIADKKGHPVALLLMSLGAAISLMLFSFDPVKYALVAAIGYGLIYFPVWGILSSWVAQRYSPIATMQLSGLGMVASAVGGSLGNLVAGTLQELTGTLELLYLLLAASSAALCLLTLLMVWQQRQKPYEYRARLNTGGSGFVQDQKNAYGHQAQTNDPL